MRVIHKGLLTLAGAALLATTLPALAQQRPIYNAPQGGSTSGVTPYNFNARQNAPAEDPLVAQERAFETNRAQLYAVAMNDQKLSLMRGKQAQQNLKAALDAQYGKARPQNAGGNVSAPRTATAPSRTQNPNVKMIYKKPEDEKKEPGRLFNLKWR